MRLVEDVCIFRKHRRYINNFTMQILILMRTHEPEAKGEIVEVSSGTGPSA